MVVAILMESEMILSDELLTMIIDKVSVFVWNLSYLADWFI